MNVYLVWFDGSGDSRMGMGEDDIIGVFSSNEKAEQFISTKAEDRQDLYWIDEQPVDAF
jgi:hypothetical protein